MLTIRDCVLTCAVPECSWGGGALKWGADTMTPHCASMSMYIFVSDSVAIWKGTGASCEAQRLDKVLRAR